MRSVIVNRKSTEDILEFENETYQIDYFTKAKHVDLPNQDSLLVMNLGPKTVVMGVADGMGGHDSGDEASQMILEAVRHEAFKYEKGKAPLADAILAGIFNGHKKIQSKIKGAGTTVCLAVIHQGKVQFYCTGDSIGIVVTGKNFIDYQTVEHSPVGYLLASGAITEKQAIVHKDKNLVTNVVGHDPVRVEISPWITLSQRDSVMLFTDGIRNLDVIDNLISKLKTCFRKRNSHEFLSQFSQDQFSDDITLINARAKNYV